MKPAAYILTFIMLFLMAQPLLIECQAKIKIEPAKAMCGAKSCQKKVAPKAAKKSCDNDKNKECDRANACNPFASCSQCQYVAVSRYLYTENSVQAKIKKLGTANENTLTGFRNDCWQPPE